MARMTVLVGFLLFALLINLCESVDSNVIERYEIEKRKRNVLILFADDGGFQQTAYNDTVCDTPHLDELAKRSVIFRRAYTSDSSGSPSRSVLLTGTPSHENGLYGLHSSFNHFQSFDRTRSLPNILSRHKILTGIIGKYDVAPAEDYKFHYEQVWDVDQCGRNISRMRDYMREFLKKAKHHKKSFFLYMAFHDPHRGDPKYGQFMNKWGDGQSSHGTIPGWKPKRYDPKDVIVPPYVQDTPAARGDIAEMYTSFNRLDQGVGMFLKELERVGFLDDTLIVWTSDNAIPFANAKTNLYESGMAAPMMISSPHGQESWGKYTDALASTMDVFPTVLDWFKLGDEYLNAVTGRSLLPLTEDPKAKGYTYVFGSHDIHEISTVAPMRVMRDERYRFIHNINFRAPFPIAMDVYYSPSFQDLLERRRKGEPTHWFKTLHQYYYRDEYELFDLQKDPMETTNVFNDPMYFSVAKSMNQTLTDWLFKTHDPWRCMPHSMLLMGKCQPMYNQFNRSLF